MRAQSVNAAQASILACLEDHNRRNDWPDSEYHLGREIPIDADDPDSAFTAHIICDTVSLAIALVFPPTSLTCNTLNALPTTALS